MPPFWPHRAGKMPFYATVGQISLLDELHESYSDARLMPFGAEGSGKKRIPLSPGFRRAEGISHSVRAFSLLLAGGSLVNYLIIKYLPFQKSHFWNIFVPIMSQSASRHLLDSGEISWRPPPQNGSIALYRYQDRYTRQDIDVV